MAPARSSSSSCSAPPTVPWPSRPTLNVTRGQVLVGLAADNLAGLTLATEDHGRPRHAVVVVGHRVAVRARRRGDEDVAGARLVQQHVLDEDVARLAVL